MSSSDSGPVTICQFGEAAETSSCEHVVQPGDGGCGRVGVDREKAHPARRALEVDVRLLDLFGDDGADVIAAAVEECHDHDPWSLARQRNSISPLVYEGKGTRLARCHAVQSHEGCKFAWHHGLVLVARSDGDGPRWHRSGDRRRARVHPGCVKDMLSQNTPDPEHCRRGEHDVDEFPGNAGGSGGECGRPVDPLIASPSG